MITKQTTFILGAGASHPYGFPLASGLLKSIHFHGKKLKSYLEIKHESQKKLQVGAHEVEAFLNDLKQGSAAGSIDLFLYHRKDYLEIGKLLIAYTISRYEKVAKLLPLDSEINEDWYSYLFRRMIEDCPLNEFPENKVRFITFNYDRSLEYFFHHSLKSIYHIDDQKAYELVRSLDIIHVNGSLGNYMDIEEKGGFYGPLNWDDYEKLIYASQEIKLIYDLNEEDRSLKFYQLFHESEYLFILGFGFHKLNIKVLLDDKKYIKTLMSNYHQPHRGDNITKERIMSKNPYIKATGFGLGEAEKRMANAEFRSRYFEIDIENLLSIDLLKKHLYTW